MSADDGNGLLAFEAGLVTPKIGANRIAYIKPSTPPTKSPRQL
jgi:hypothetical protein